MTLNFLRQIKYKSKVSAYKCIEWPFGYNAISMGLLRCPIVIHKKTSQRHTWDFCGCKGWSIGATMESHYLIKVILWDTIAVTISDTVEYFHEHLTVSSMTSANQIMGGLQSLTRALADTLTAHSNKQLKVIRNLCKVCQHWQAMSDRGQRSVTP
jgi:hypothetical protein